MICILAKNSPKPFYSRVSYWLTIVSYHQNKLCTCMNNVGISNLPWYAACNFPDSAVNVSTCCCTTTKSLSCPSCFRWRPWTLAMSRPRSSMDSEESFSWRRVISSFKSLLNPWISAALASRLVRSLIWSWSWAHMDLKGETKQMRQPKSCRTSAQLRTSFSLIRTKTFLPRENQVAYTFPCIVFSLFEKKIPFSGHLQWQIRA